MIAERTNGMVDSDSDDYDDDDNEEMDDSEPTKCLFCNIVSSSVDTAIEHLRLEHKICLAQLKSKFTMDFYGYIKMINYIRTIRPSVQEFLAYSQEVWDDEKFLKPIEPVESWMMFDFDSLKGKGDQVEELGAVTISAKEYTALQKTVELLKRELNEKNGLLEHAASDISQMRETYTKLLEREDERVEKSKFIPSDVACVGNLSLKDDEGYFSSYAHYGIHYDMLSDEVRTTSYRDAILRNGETFMDKIVMDLGCGTSILSMFSSKAGAARVIGIDNSDIIYQAMDIVRKNNITNIELVKGRIEDTELPVDKVDIIVSEWMGYFLLFEGMLDSVIYARNRHLKPGGILLPNRCNISLVGYGDIEQYKKFIGFWTDVYGFDMSCMRKEVLREATIEICKAEHVLSTADVIADFNLMTVDVNCPNFSHDFTLDITKTGELTSLVGYFDTFFELLVPVDFSTSPAAKPTHWKQIVFYLKKIVPVTAGDKIQGKFICQRNYKDVRSLSIIIEVFDSILKYSLN